MIKLKKCCTCKKEKIISYFSSNISKKDGFCRACKTCEIERGRIYKNLNRESIRIRRREYRKKHRQQIIIEKRNYRIKHRGFYNKNQNERRRKYMNELGDHYIKIRLTRNFPNIKWKDIPQSLIECKREHLRITRTIKNIENEII